MRTRYALELIPNANMGLVPDGTNILIGRIYAIVLPITRKRIFWTHVC
jgi:hypothetical protein